MLKSILIRRSLTDLYLIYLPMFFSFSVVPYKQIDPALAPFVDKYYSLVEKSCKKGQYEDSWFHWINFAKQDSKTIAACQSKVNGYKIEVDPTWWSKANEADREQLIFHELAHCVIDHDHVDDAFNYMFPSFATLDPDVVINQVQADITQHCSGN